MAAMHRVKLCEMLEVERYLWEVVALFPWNLRMIWLPVSARESNMTINSMTESTRCSVPRITCSATKHEYLGILRLQYRMVLS